MRIISWNYPEGLNVRTQKWEWVWISPCENTAGNYLEVSPQASRLVDDVFKHVIDAELKKNKRKINIKHLSGPIHVRCLQRQKHMISTAEFICYICIPRQPLAWKVWRFMSCCEHVWPWESPAHSSYVKGKVRRKSAANCADIFLS